MTNYEQHRRRLKMAQEVKSGEDPGEVAKRYKVHLHSVNNACQENGVAAKNTGLKRVKVSTFKILRALLGGARQVDLARKNKVSKQQINAIAQKAICAGFFLPHYSAETSKRK